MSLQSWYSLPEEDRERLFLAVQRIAFPDAAKLGAVNAERHQEGIPDDIAEMFLEQDIENRESLVVASAIDTYNRVADAFDRLAFASKSLADLSAEETGRLLKAAKELIRQQCYCYSVGDPEADIATFMNLVQELVRVAQAPVHTTGARTRKGLNKGRDNRWGASPEEHRAQAQKAIDKILAQSDSVLWTKTALKKQVVKETKLSESTVRTYINDGKVSIPPSRLKTE